MHLTWLGFTKIRFEFMKIGSPGSVGVIYAVVVFHMWPPRLQAVQGPPYFTMTM